MPFRKSRSRKPGTPVSIVTTSAVKPAALARFNILMDASRPPQRYT